MRKKERSDFIAQESHLSFKIKAFSPPLRLSLPLSLSSLSVFNVNLDICLVWSSIQTQISSNKYIPSKSFKLGKIL